MNRAIIIALIVVVEIVLAKSAFPHIAAWLQGHDDPAQPEGKDIAKGILERFIVVAGLLMGHAEVITFFAALKLGTRLQPEARQQISNDYFFVGTIVSLLVALFYVWLWTSA